MTSGSADDLLRAEAWPDGLDRPVVREETHISIVLLRGGVALKIKKAVRFPYVDFSTPELRRAACVAEVTLNRRLAPDVYDGVVDIRLDPQGRWTLVGNGTVIDAAVHMRRLPEDATFEAKLERGELRSAELTLLADRIAAFHATAARGPDIDAHATPERIAAVAEECFLEVGEAAATLLGADTARSAQDRLRAFLRDNSDRLNARIATGRICDGHGDLRLDHVYLIDGRITVLDCVEFSDRYRCGDVANDIAFLAMDLSWRGRTDLAERWLAAYAFATGDFDLYGVIGPYLSYRAWVRAKIEVSANRLDRAQRYLHLAAAELSEPVAAPGIVVVFGQIASGKSTAARRIGHHLCAPVVGSDALRKRLLGARPTERLGSGESFSGPYDASTTDRVYAELLRLAEVVIRSGRSVVLDATYSTRELRRGPVELAHRLAVAVDFVETWAPVETLRRRLRQREGQVTESDAREDLLDDFLARWEPPEEVRARRIAT